MAKSNTAGLGGYFEMDVDYGVAKTKKRLKT